MNPTAPLPHLPTHAGANVWPYFGRSLRNTRTRLFTLGFVVVAFVAGAALVSPVIGLGFAAAALLISLVIVWTRASGRSEDDFFIAYAAHRGLDNHDGKGQLPPATPLLGRGDRRYTGRQLIGALPGDIDGTLAFFTYEVESRDSKGNTQTSYYHFTVILTRLAGTAAFINEFHCERRSGWGVFDGLEDKFRKRQRVECESAVVDKRHEIFIGADDSLNRARQILTPSFLVWLGESAPDEFFFELSRGELVTAVKGHRKRVTELDGLLEANSVVARRLLDEAAE